MSAPFAGASLEDHLGRLNALLRVVEHALEHRDDEDLADGADVCLGYALDVLDKIQTGLPSRILDQKVIEGK